LLRFLAKHSFLWLSRWENTPFTKLVVTVNLATYTVTAKTGT